MIKTNRALDFPLIVMFKLLNLTTLLWENISNKEAADYAKKEIQLKLNCPNLSFEIANGLKIKSLSNYLDDIRSSNYASFIEWLNLNK